MDRPREGGARLVDWFTHQPTCRAFKTRSCSRFFYFFIFFFSKKNICAIICIGGYILCLPYTGFFIYENTRNQISDGVFPQRQWLTKLSLFSCIGAVARNGFLKHRPSGPMLSISRNVRPSVRLFVRLSVRLSVCSLLRYRLNVFWPPLPEVGCPIFLEIRHPWGNVMERSGLRSEHFCLKVV